MDKKAAELCSARPGHTPRPKKALVSTQLLLSLMYWL